LKGFVLVTSGAVKEGMQLLDEATVLALSDQASDIHTITTTCCFLIDACQRVRDFDRAGQWCVRVKDICLRWRHKAVFATCRAQYAAVLISKGQWVEAEDELIQAISELRTFKPASVHVGQLRLADLRRRQGRWSDATALFDDVSSAAKALPSAALLFDMSEFGRAYDIVERFLRQTPEHEKTERISGLELMIQINVLLNHLDVAEMHLNELADIALAIDTLPLRAAHVHARGIYHYGKEEFDLSRKDLEDAIDLYELLGAPFEAARARTVLANSLIRLRNHAQADNELNIAIKAFKILGAQRDLDKARSQLKQLGAPGVSDQGFTRRELDILRLVAEGKNNDEIADGLSISLRTVEKHLSNIYQKLGTSGKSARAHAASFASTKLTAR
jgi:DNA-binding CsgD family transcriptional regulator